MSSCLHLAKNFSVNISFFPLAVPETIFSPGPALHARSLGISFVGNIKGELYANRKQNLEVIRQSFPGIPAFFGKGIYLKHLASLYQQSKIVYNDSINQTMTLRIFEALGTNALVISDSVPEQDIVLTRNMHYVYYESPRQLIKKIRHFSVQLHHAQRIADQGHRWAMKHHTFSVRAAQLVALFQRFR